jgi:hypothetical protein
MGAEEAQRHPAVTTWLRVTAAAVSSLWWATTSVIIEPEHHAEPYATLFSARRVIKLEQPAMIAAVAHGC